jgi:heme exporter protein B
VIWSLFYQQFKREWLVQRRQIRVLITSSLFFLMLLLFFPLGLSPDPKLLRFIVPGLLWMALLLSMLLSSERLFSQDYEDGVMEQWLVCGRSVEGIVFAKISAYCCFHLLAILALCPLIALFFSFTSWEIFVLLASLCCGAPGIFFLSALTASFGVGMKQKGALMPLILFPLTLPFLIFGSASMTMAMAALDVRAYLAILLALSILAVGFLPFAIAGVIRVNGVD